MIRRRVAYRRMAALLVGLVVYAVAYCLMVQPTPPSGGAFNVPWTRYVIFRGEPSEPSDFVEWFFEPAYEIDSCFIRREYWESSIVCPPR